jgi:hypothetical protein
MRKLFVPIAVLLSAAVCHAQGHGNSMHFRFAGADGGSMVQLALRPDVMKELAITSDENTKLLDLEKRMQDAVTANLDSFSKSGETDPNKMRDAIGATGDKFAMELPSILTADQAKRLRELLIQKNGYGALNRKDLQEELALTDDEKAKLSAANGDMLKAFDGMRTSSTMDPKMMRKAVQEAIDARNKAIESALTDDQRSKFEAMKGTPFTFDDAAKLD